MRRHADLLFVVGVFVLVHLWIRTGGGWVSAIPLFMVMALGVPIAQAYAGGATPTASSGFRVLADDAPCSPAADEWHARARRELQDLGFLAQPRVRQILGERPALEGLNLREEPRVRWEPTEFVIAREFHNPASGEVAVAWHRTRRVTMRHSSRHSSHAVEEGFIEFATRFGDGGYVCTNNAPFHNPDPDPPGTATHWLPQLTALSDLYQAHRRLTSATGRAVAPVSLGRPLQWISEAEARSLESLAERGLAVVRGGVRRDTWKGVLRAQWLTWIAPTERDKRARAAALIAELGLRPRAHA